MMVRAFAASGVTNPIHIVRSGAEALDYLAGNGKFSDREKFPMPKIVFLDMKMPHPDGMYVLKWKERHGLNGILWVATSSFDGVRTINEAYAAGATTFLTKPLDRADIRNLIQSFNDYWRMTAQDRRELNGFTAEKRRAAEING